MYYKFLHIEGCIWMNSGGKVLSVVIPIYNEVNIEPNITRVMEVLSNAKIKYEIILVDDGSRNNAWGRNFGYSR